MKKPVDAAIRFVRRHAEEFIIGVIIAVVAAALIAILGIDSGGGSRTTITEPAVKPKPTHNRERIVTFTVENDVRDGVWALTSPVMRRFSSKDERPLNASRWLPNGTLVVLRCADVGTEYNVVLNEEFDRWRFFGVSEKGFYVPMAGFKQTISDGAQGLSRCKEETG